MLKFLLLSVLALIISSCGPSSSCSKPDTKIPEPVICPDLPEQPLCEEEALREQLAASEVIVGRVCDQFESEIKTQFTPTTFTVVQGQWSYSPCDNEIQVTVRKVEKDLVYLHYLVGEEDRYSDPLYFVGDKRDRNSLFIADSLQDPVLLYVNTCDGISCEISCVQFKVNQLSCFGEGIIEK